MQLRAQCTSACAARVAARRSVLSPHPPGGVVRLPATTQHHRAHVSCWAVSAAPDAPSAPRAAPGAPSGQLPELTQETFYEYLRAQGDTLVVVDFYTALCGPCKLIAPELVKLQADRPDIRIAKVRCDKSNKELGLALGIKVAPTFLLYRNSVKVAEMTGAHLDELVALIDKACGAPKA